MKRSATVVVLLALAGLAVAGDGTDITYTVDGAQFEGYYVSPKKDAPLVILVHDWDGLTGYEKKRAGMLAEKGYAVFAVDLFGKGIRPAEAKDRRALTAALYTDREKMRALLNGGIAAAKSQGAAIDNAVAMGYCFGGTAVLELARSGAALKGFVTFHGGLETPEGQGYSDTKGSLLILHGTTDTHVTMEHFAALAQQLEKAGVTHEMITYSNAPHAFSVFGSERYRKEADRKSWTRFVGFLGEVLGE